MEGQLQRLGGRQCKCGNITPRSNNPSIVVSRKRPDGNRYEQRFQILEGQTFSAFTRQETKSGAAGLESAAKAWLVYRLLVKYRQKIKILMTFSVNVDDGSRKQRL